MKVLCTSWPCLSVAVIKQIQSVKSQEVHQLRFILHCPNVTKILKMNQKHNSLPIDATHRQFCNFTILYEL